MSNARLLTVPTLAALGAPFLLGVLPPESSVPVLALLVIVALKRAWKLLLALVSVSLTIASLDVALRPFSPPLFHNNPLTALETHERLPSVWRFLPNLDYTGTSYGDLTFILGVQEWWEERKIRFATDAHGFRNEDLKSALPLDFIILGDSYGAGSVSQEDTWPAAFQEKGLSSYNLSVPGANPWQEYINLLVEIDRLPADERTVVIWQMFSGNDLDGPYGPVERGELPWHNRKGQLIQRFVTFRRLSPLRRLIQPVGQLFSGGQGPYFVIDKDFLNRRKVLFHSGYAEVRDMTVEEVVSHPHYDGLAKSIRALKALADARRLRVLIVLAPSKEEVYSWVLEGGEAWSTSPGPSGFSLALQDIAAREGIDLLDLKPHLLKEARRAYEEEGKLLWWYEDTHWNAQGQRFTASTILSHLGFR